MSFSEYVKQTGQQQDQNVMGFMHAARQRGTYYAQLMNG